MTLSFAESAVVLALAVENSGEAMPIYEYYCESCDCQFETLVFRSTDPVACPTCSTGEVKRVLSVFGFKSGGDKGAASSRMGSGAGGCSGCAASNCSSCH